MNWQFPEGNLESHIPLKNYQKAASDASIMTFTNIMNGLLALVPPILVAAIFGLKSITDAYFMAISIILILSKLLELGPLSKIYVSILSEYITSNREKLEKVISNFININIVFFGIVSILLILICPAIVSLIAPGFDTQTKMQTIRMTRILIPTIISTSLSGLFVSVLHSFKKFSFPAICQPIPILVVALIAILGLKRFGIISLIWGSFLGKILYSIFLYIGVRKIGLKYSFIFNFRAIELKKTIKLVSSFFISSAFEQGKTFVQSFLASWLPGGSFSALAYGRKLRSYVLNYLYETIPTIIYPSLAKEYTLDNRKKIRHLVIRGSRMSAFVMFPLLILMFVLCRQIIIILFQRGNFGEVATNNVTIVSMVLLAGMFPGAITVLFRRTLFAMQETKWINIARIITQLITIILSIIFFRLFGLFGLALALAFGTSLRGIQYYIRINKYIKFKSLFTDANFLKISLVSLIMGIGCFMVNSFLIRNFGFIGLWRQSMHIFLAASASLLLYFVLAHLLKIEEYKVIKDIIASKFRSFRKRQTV
jgi:putative peptidoglycan lipid II flippase